MSTIFRTILPVLTLAAVLFSCQPKGDEVVTLTFDPSQEVSSVRVPLTRFSDTIPSDWSAYNYLVMEVKTNTPQRFFFGLNTESGYNEICLNFYAPGEWVRTAIPLEYLSKAPAGALDLAATFNHKRPMTFINIDNGTRGPLVGVSEIGFRLHYPVGEPKIEIRSLYLSVEDPGDEYLGTTPNVDEFGQWALGDYEGKAHNEQELRDDWAKEDAELAAAKAENISKFGGNTTLKSRATGYFRTEKIDGKWWFIDPEGNYFLSLGADCMSPQMKSKAAIMRYGEDGMEQANQKIIDRSKAWGFNTIANWSSPLLIAMNQLPYAVQLGRIGIESGVMGLADIYEEGFEQKNFEALKAQLEPHAKNPYLLGYFIGNEPAWSLHEARLCELIEEQPDERPLKVAYKKYLEANGDTEANRLAFIFSTFDKFLDITIKNLRKIDPNHLTLGIRFGSGAPSDEVLEICGKHFDVYSFNAYLIAPDNETVNYIAEKTGKPLIGGEYHFGTVDRGLAMSLVQVNSQKERGLAYRYYTEQGLANPNLIGLAYFQWNDQPILGRGDGENYNIGLVDITDRPYTHMVEAIKETSSKIYDIHAGKVAPYDKKIERAAVMGKIPDIF